MIEKIVQHTKFMAGKTPCVGFIQARWYMILLALLPKLQLIYSQHFASFRNRVEFLSGTIIKISRFARNTRDLLELIEQLNAKGVEFVSKKESIDTTTPTGKFMLTVFGAVAELEREYILQRQREGIAIAKEQGKYKGRRPNESPEFERVTAKWRRGEITAAEAMRILNMSKSSFYRRVKSSA